MLPNLLLRGVSLASRFLFTIFLARWLSVADVGAYGLAVSALAISNFVLGVEYYWFTMRELMAKPAQSAHILRDQIALHALLYVTAGPLLVLLFWRTLPPDVFVWFCALMVIEHLSQESIRALIALGRPLAANVILFFRVGAWVYPVLLIGWLRPDDRGLQPVFIAWTAGLLASLAVAAWKVRLLDWHGASWRRVDWAGVRTGVNVAAPFVAVTGSTMVLLFVDRFIIAEYLGTEAVGVFTFYAGVTTAIHQLVNTSVTLVGVGDLVRAHTASADDFRRQFKHTAIAISSATVVAAIVAAAAIYPVLHFVGRAAYSDAIGVFYGLLLAAVLRCVADIPLYGLYASRRDRAVVLTTAAAAVASVGLNLLLVPRFGLAGATVAAVTGSCIVLAGASASLVRQMPFIFGVQDART